MLASDNCSCLQFVHHEADMVVLQRLRVLVWLNSACVWREYGIVVHIQKPGSLSNLESRMDVNMKQIKSLHLTAQRKWNEASRRCFSSRTTWKNEVLHYKFEDYVSMHGQSILSECKNNFLLHNAYQKIFVLNNLNSDAMKTIFFNGNTSRQHRPWILTSKPWIF